MNNGHGKIGIPAVLAFAAALLLSLSLNMHQAQAGPSQGGGFTGPGPSVARVADALSMRDDVHVSLRGYITQSLGDEKYTFKDDSGSITVEIDDDEWRGLNVGPTDLVEIQGEVDKEWMSVEIDVDRIRKAQ